MAVAKRSRWKPSAGSTIIHLVRVMNVMKEEEEEEEEGDER